ncbi:MAG TPA: extracellular solute-binding protein [Acidobacteriota bacterium]|nr:extracellular solute-binding protein [Acidobacteriota bacterium]
MFGIGLAACALTLTCGGGQQAKTDDGRTIIRFWQFWTEPRVKAVITQAVAEFEEENSEYSVEVTDLTWDNGYQKIVAAFAAERVPDLIELGSDWVTQFADRGALMDLTSEFGNMQMMYAGWAPAIYGNACWALPWYISTRVFYQNDDIAKLVQGGARPHPIVWGTIAKNAQVATVRKPQMWGYGVNAAEPHRLYKKFLPFLWSAGGEILNEDMSACALNSDAGRLALDFVAKTADFGIIEKQAALDELFVEGKLLYHLSGDWLYEKLKRSGTSMEYSVFMIPFPAPAVGGQVSFAGGEYLAIPRRGAQKIAALKLARHLLLKKHIFNLCIATGCATPVHREVAQDPYFAQDSIRRVFIDQIGRSKSPPNHPRWVDIEAALEWGIEQALYKKLSVDEALRQTCERIDAILQSERES